MSNFGQVINRVGISQILVMNRVRVLGSGPHTPTQFFWEYPSGALPASKRNFCSKILKLRELIIERLKTQFKNLSSGKSSPFIACS